MKSGCKLSNRRAQQSEKLISIKLRGKIASKPTSLHLCNVWQGSQRGLGHSSNNPLSGHKLRSRGILSMPLGIFVTAPVAVFTSLYDRTFLGQKSCFQSYTSRFGGEADAHRHLYSSSFTLTFGKISNSTQDSFVL